MKKVFSLALTIVALLGIIQVTATPSYAGHCEECCYVYYEECLELASNPQTCTNMLNNCIASCQ